MNRSLISTELEISKLVIKISQQLGYEVLDWVYSIEETTLTYINSPCTTAVFEQVLSKV